MMMPRTPLFWYDSKEKRSRLLSSLLAPLGKAYGWCVQKRFDLYFPVPLEKPIICVGNLTAGGAGKTPVAISLAGLLQDKGYNPHFLSRGYGGLEEGPLQVNPGRDTVVDVGDEPLLLVEKAPTWVAVNRPQGAQAAFDTGANMVIMDDGFQNPVIYKDFSLIVIDGAVGFGNKNIFPAGPLREPIKAGLQRANAVIIVGDDVTDVTSEIRRHSDVPILAATLKASSSNPDLFGKTVYAFAGIGRPDKFKESLIAAGAVVEGWGSYPDHFAYEEEDLRELVTEADARGAMIITTAKDHVRLPPALKQKVNVFSVMIEWQNPDDILQLIDAALQKR